MLFFAFIYLLSMFGQYDHSKLSQAHSFSDFISPDCALLEMAPSVLVVDSCNTYIKDTQQHDGHHHQLQHVQLHEQPQQVNNFLNPNLQLELQLLSWQFWQMRNINSLTLLSLMKTMTTTTTTTTTNTTTYY